MKNWRLMIGKKKSLDDYDWRTYKYKEFINFLEEAEALSRYYNWNFWGGGVNNYAVTLSQGKRDGLSISICLLSLRNYSYYASFEKAWNPNNVSKDSYKTFISNNYNDVIDYLDTYLEKNSYCRENASERICVMGGAFDRYPLAMKWANEELENKRFNHN